MFDLTRRMVSYASQYQRTSTGGSSTEEVPFDHLDVTEFVLRDCTGFIAPSHNEEYQNLQMRILFPTVKGGVGSVGVVKDINFHMNHYC